MIIWLMIFALSSEPDVTLQELELGQALCFVMSEDSPLPHPAFLWQELDSH